jgi:hypothetical protein
VVRVEGPTVVGALDILSIEVAAVKGHAAVRTSVPQREGTAGAVAPNHQGDFKQHGFVKLIAMDTVGGQRAIPEAGEHQRIRRLALRGVEFGHGS